MRLLMCITILTLAGTVPAEQGKAITRYGYELDEESFPQKNPQEAIRSVVKAIANQKLPYLMAHLADPAFVDARVAKYKKLIDKGKEEGKTLLAFRRVVKETEDHFLEDPQIVQDLKRFAKEGDIKTEEDRAIVSVKGVIGRQVHLRRIGDRCFLEDRQR